MKKVVITGATSMIGTALIQYLISQGIEVLAISRRMTDELTEFEKTGKCKVAICDLEEISLFRTISLDGKVLYDNDYDAFIHLAWAGTFGVARQHEDLQIQSIQYTLDCAKLAHRLGCHTFLGVGSQAEYGRVDGVIKYDTPTNPDTPYGIAKLAACRMSRHYAQSMGMKHVWVRIFSVYGPHDNPKTMIMSSIANLLDGKPMSYTEATQMWNYLYVEDAARGIALACDKGKDGEVYCIAFHQNYPLKDYILCLRETINEKAEIEFGKVPCNGSKPIELFVDTAREIKELGFYPDYTFYGGLLKTIEWYKKNKN